MKKTTPIEHSELSFRLELRHIVEQSGCTQAEYADSIGISPAYLSDILNGKRAPGDKVLQAIGFEKVIKYVKVSQ